MKRNSITFYHIKIEAIPIEKPDFFDMVLNNQFCSRRCIEMKNHKISFTSTPFPRLDLPDNDWEKQYKEDCEFIRNIPDEYKTDEKDYGEFFIPSLVYMPTEMPQYMKDLCAPPKVMPQLKESFLDSIPDLNTSLDNIQKEVNKVLLQSVYNGYLYLIDSARNRGDEVLEKEYIEKAEDILSKIKLLEEGKLK